MSERADGESGERRNSGPMYTASLVLLVSALLAGFALIPRIFRPQASPLAGKDAPNFSLPVVLNAPNKDHPQISMGELRGQVVLLDFWATWCGPCQIEAPIVDRIAARYKSRGLVVIGVNTSDREGNAGVWARAHGLSYPIAYDGENAAANVFGVQQLPTLVLVSRSGKILDMRTGITDDSDLDGIIRRAL